MSRFFLKLNLDVAEDGAAFVHVELNRDATLTEPQRKRIDQVLGGLFSVFGDPMYGIGYGEKDYPGPIDEEEEEEEPNAGNTEGGVVGDPEGSVRSRL